MNNDHNHFWMICLTFDYTFLNFDSLKLLSSVFLSTTRDFTSTFGGDFLLSFYSIFKTASLYLRSSASYWAYVLQITFFIGVDGLTLAMYVPVRNAISELFVWNVYAVILLSLLDLAFDLIVFSKVPKLLNKWWNYFSIGASWYGSWLIHSDEILSSLLNIGRFKLLPSTNN